MNMKNVTLLDRKTQAIRKRIRDSSISSNGRTPESRAGEGACSVIPHYRDTNRVLPSHARLDKVGVGMDLGFIDFENSEDAQAFWFYLGASPKEQRGQDAARAFGTLFKSTPYKGKQKFALKIRAQAIEHTGAGETLGIPLFSAGKLESRRKKDGQKVRCYLAFAPWSPLKLNPSRAINHRVSELTDKSGLLWSQQMFAKRKDEVLYSADGNDNIIPSAIDQNTYNEAERVYFEKVVESLLSEINRAMRSATGIPEFPEGSSGDNGSYNCPTVALQSVTLNEVETYWEMRVPSASSFMEDTKQLLLSYGSASRLRYASGECDEELLEGNSRSILIRLGNGESIRIYAKLADRIRFEVIHNPAQQSSLLNGCRTASNVKELIEKIETLKIRGSVALNELLDYLSQWSEGPPQKLAATDDYKTRWLTACGSKEHSLSVYDLLRFHGRLVGGKAVTEDQFRILRTARRAGLLSFRNGAFYPLKGEAAR